MSDQFYLQDSRSYVGNDMLFWAKNGQGYTTDLRLAQVFTSDEAQRLHNSRETDIPWPKAYIDAKTRPAVDVQYVSRSEALTDSGIVIKKPERVKPEALRCHACGSFINAETYYLGQCSRCGAENRP